MTRHVLCTGVNFNAGNDSRISNGFNKGSAVFLLLANRFVVKDRATNRLTESSSGHNQFAVRAPRLLCLRNT